ncbi:hypothetical protein B0H65DRAFT_544442 [Neurospora tetraspora]|uniref:Uncharacterized protein n=1 Tax=Neurospora tetraspora TaxID=94610 RepID=A0AAE0JP60_9PEZI|nr:hypothetical protein B0H65DRAFT_544442 [Neurospora tetraspora]
MHWQNRIAFSIIVGMVAGAFAFALTYQCFRDYQRRRTLPRGADESPPVERTGGQNMEELGRTAVLT